MKKWNVTIVAVSFLMLGMLAGCGHEHVWNEATCKEPQTCEECGETQGEALGHEWTSATCTEPKTCEECGESKGEALGHKWKEATCKQPQTCETCGETQGSALEHTWKEANCSTPKTCSVCGTTDGEKLEHSLNSKGKCTLCGEQVGFALNSSNYKDYLSVKFSSGKNDIGYYTVTCTVEPLKNVTFGDVKIVFGYTATNSKYKEMNGYVEHNAGVNAEGYGTSSYMTDTNKTSGTKPSNLKFVSISGYVIE